MTGATTPLTDEARDLESVWTAFLWIAAGVGGLVVALLLFVVIRYRRRDDTLPRQTREHIRLEVGYTIVPLLVVAGLFAITLGAVRAVDRVDAAEAPDLVVEVIGFQWQWQFDYPDAGVRIVGSDTVIPELVLPADSTVRFEMTSLDVIHSFWIPGFRFKRDVFPGETTRFEVDVADEIGRWDTGVCAEFCGLDHHAMRFSVRVMPPEEFATWLAEQGSP